MRWWRRPLCFLGLHAWGRWYYHQFVPDIRKRYCGCGAEQTMEVPR